MRNFLSLVLSFFIIMASVPVVSLFYKDELLTKSEQITATESAALPEKAQSTQQSASPSEPKSEQTSAPAVKEATSTATAKPDKVKVLLHKEKKIVTVKTEFYIISVLAKEIDIAAPAQALKAQAVCIYTFLLRCIRQEANAKYDITDNPAHHQSFLSESALKKFWGENYRKNYEKLQKIVADVSGQYLSYEGQPALTAYHSSNAGMTESAENYWGEEYPYLKATQSIGDSLCNHYQSTTAFTPAALKKALLTLKGKNFSFPASPSDWVGAAKTTASHTVLQIEIAGVKLSGREVRKALGLKSSFFTVAYNGKQFIFTVSGYGHGIGMSQEGAKYMAALGFTYKEILLHYYKHCTLAE